MYPSKLFRDELECPSGLVFADVLVPDDFGNDGSDKRPFSSVVSVAASSHSPLPNPPPPTTRVIDMTSQTAREDATVPRRAAIESGKFAARLCAFHAIVVRFAVDAWQRWLGMKNLGDVLLRRLRRKVG